MRNLCLLLSIVECFFLCAATSYDIQEVRITSSDLLKERSKVHKILSNKPLYIIFDGFNVKSLSCVSENKMQYLLPGKHTLVNFNNGTSILKTPGLTGYAKITFACVVKQVNVNINVEINIESAYRILSTVDGVPLQFYLRETPEYESVTNHVCEEGQVVDLTCSKYLNYGRLKLKYYDQNGTKLVETDEVGSKDPLNFRLLARAENHQSYVDCIHIDDVRHNGTEFTYRVMFAIMDKNRNNSSFIITINGIEFTSLAAYAKDYDVYNMIYPYHYKFIYSDTLNITCENNDINTVSDIVASLLTRSKMVESVVKQTQSLYSPYVQVYSVETKYLDRAIMVFHFRDLNKTKIYEAMIKFDMDDRDDPVILGLTESNVLYQYNKSATEWFIHYQYMVNEVLRLTCVVKKNNYLQWIYGESILLPVLLNVAYGTSYISYDFHTDNETKEIICITRSIAYGTSRTTIVLHKIPDLPSLKIENEIVPEKQSTTFEIIGIIVGLLLAGMCAFCCWKMKKRAQANKEKKLARNASQDTNRVDDFTDQTGSPEYALIEYSDTTHSDALNVNQGSSTPIRAPAPPPRSAMPAKNTCLQLPPRRCNGHRETNNRSGVDCKHNENEYDYVYGGKKKCPCVTPSNRGARKPRARDPAQEL